MSRKISILLLCFVLISCTKDKEQNIAAPFQAYVRNFFLEGNKRGLNLQLEDVDLTINFGSLPGSNAGQCSFRNNTITIDRDAWNTLNEEEKTWLIFHELGHCILNRQHKNRSTNNEECLSIMKGIENGFECSFNYYSDKWWRYYLDELFNQSTPLPLWYSSVNKYDSISVKDTILEIDTFTNILTLDTIDLYSTKNFNLDFSFDNFNTNQSFIKFYLGNIGYSSCDICTGTNVQISSDLPERVYYKNYSGSIQFKTDVKLTIRKTDDLMYFFTNERFIHVMEANLWSAFNLNTIYFNESIRMRLLITELEG